MSDTKISALTALTGANVDTAADVLAIVDTSVTTTKKILIDELRIALGIATQAQQETATSLVVTVTPGRQQYHPSAAKAWGAIATPTTVAGSYPAAGVSVVKDSTGTYTVTHGVTISSTVYSLLVQLNAAGSNWYSPRISSRTTTTFQVIFVDSTGNLNDPTGFMYAIYGDV